MEVPVDLWLVGLALVTLVSASVYVATSLQTLSHAGVP